MSMHAALSEVADVPRDQLAKQDSLWAGDVRELSHDIEDLVESFLVSAEGASAPLPNQDSFKVIMAKMDSLLKMAKARRKLGTAVKGVRGQVHEVANRDDRYRGRGVARPAWIPIDPLLSVLYQDHKLVGMDDARDKMIRKLREPDDRSKKEPKIISIVGFGGLGKTTLAKAVYDKLRGAYNCAAFVSVSRNPDVRKVFKDLLYEVDKKKYNSSNLADLDERQLIDELRESLGTERYFIVIDDIWDTKAWEIIRYAFIDGNCESRIITTTRNLDVSRACCPLRDDLIHKMKPLLDGDSKRLFCKRIFASERCPSQLEQVSEDILKKCGGVPLAIITLASHLASNQKIKPMDQWHVLLKSIGHGLTKDDPDVEEMKRILSFSYYDLPSHMRACLLYLSIFPEDYSIGRDRLIRRWVTEGFIQGFNSFELGESYFNELINRSLIQPTSIDDEGRARGCRVHDMMLDLICDLSSEENFVTVLDFVEGDKPLGRKIRRLSLQKSMSELTNTQLATTSLSQVRSFTIFRHAFSQMLPLSRFQVVRVLDLEGCDLGESGHLKLRCVGSLLHLRYLGLRCSNLKEIPKEIGKLVFLQILDLTEVNATELPANIAQLRNLIGLYLPAYTSLPVGFRDLTSLEELSNACFSENCDDDAEELQHMTKLRELSFRWPSSSFGPEKLACLVESLGKLPKLQRLKIVGDINHDMRDWVPTSPHLCRLDFDGWYQKLPTWFSSSSLPVLTYLWIKVHQLRLEDIQIIGTLPNLREVHLESVALQTAPAERATERSFMLSADAFPCARKCHFEHVVLVPWMFPPGAMPMVQRIYFDLRVSDILSCDDSGLSMRNLPLLQRVYIDLHREEASIERYYEAKASLRRVEHSHPNRPDFIISKFPPIQ